MTEKIIETYSPEETFAFARETGAKTGPGEVFVLTGDLGAGKTVFTQGFAAGLAVTEPVNSPTFTILQVYEGGRCPLYHFEDCFYGEGVSLIEWGDLIEEILPDHYVKVTISRDLEKDIDYRKICLEKIGD